MVIHAGGGAVGGRGEGWGGVERHRLAMTEQPQGHKVQHRGDSQWHCDNHGWGQVGTGNSGGVAV